MKKLQEPTKEFLKFVALTITVMIVSFYVPEEYTPILALVTFTIGFFFSEFLTILKKSKQQKAMDIEITDNQYCEIESDISGEPINNIKQLTRISFNGEEHKEYLEEFINLYLLRYGKKN